MHPPDASSTPVHAGEVTVYREDDAVVFLGDAGWSRRVPLERVATDADLQRLASELRAQPWMSDALYEQFRVEVLWLRQQLPPGK